jgi:hypothetical protein
MVAFAPPTPMRSNLAALCLFALTSACGAAFDGSTFRGEGFAFRVPQKPASWTVLKTTANAITYRDAASEGTIAVTGRCKVDGDDVPLASLTQHLFIQFTERSIESQETVPFDGREAMHTVLVAKLDGVPSKFDVWVLKKDGCVYDMYFFAPPARFAEGVAAWSSYVHGFATVRTDDG